MPGLAGAARRQALAVFGLALAVRLVFIAVDGKGEGERVGDAYDYHSYAVSLLESGRYENYMGERASRMPGYPLALAAQYALLGRSVLLTQLAQALLGAGTCVLVLLLAGRWLSGPWPLAAGVAAALCFDLVSPSARALTEGAAAFFLTLTLWLLSEDRSLRPARAAAAGASAGALTLLRPEFAPWAALLAVLAGWRSRWLNGAAMLAVCGALLLPWAARNAATLGRPVASTTAGAFNLYGWGIPRTIEERLGGPPWERAPQGLDELGRADFYAGRAKRFFLMEGTHAAALKAFALNIAFLYYPFSPALDPTFVFLLPFWLYGLRAAAGDGRRRALPLTVAYATLVYAVAGVMIPRHRESFAPALVLLAAGGAEALAGRWGERPLRRAAAAWGGACAAAWLLAPRLRELALALRDRLLS